MTVAELLTELRGQDIRLRLEGDRIKADAPAGALTEAIKARIVERRDEVVAFLRSVERAQRWPRGIVPLNADGSRIPIFAVPGHNGDVFCFVSLVKHLPPDQPFFGVRPPGLDGDEPLASVAGLATYAVEQIREARPQGPYVIAGYCAGGAIAFETAAQLERAGAQVRALVLFGCPHPTMYRGLGALQFKLTQAGLRIGYHARAIARGGLRGGTAHVRGVVGRLLGRMRRREAREEPADALTLEARQRTLVVEARTMHAIRGWRAEARVAALDLVVPSRAARRTGVRFRRWRRHAARFREHVGPDGVSIDSMLRAEHAAATAQLVEPLLRAAGAESRGERPRPGG